MGDQGVTGGRIKDQGRLQEGDLDINFSGCDENVKINLFSS